MALRTLDPRAEKDARHVRHVIERHPEIPHIKTDRAIFPHVTARRDQLPHELVIRHVRTNRVLHPIVVKLARLTCKPARIQAQEIGLPVEHVAHIALAAEQFYDQLRTLVRLLAGQETLALLQARDASHNIEIHAAQEGFITRRSV